MMPVVDGFEVLRKLKKNPKTRSIPVIILTAKIDAASERECHRLGAADYIKKPWGPRELQDRIGMVLGYPDPAGTSQIPSDESRIDGEEANNPTSEVSQPRIPPARRSHTDAEGAPPESLDLRRPPESPAQESPAGVQTENPGVPAASQPPESPAQESSTGVHPEYPEYPENPAVARARRFRPRRFRIDSYAGDDPPDMRYLKQPPAAEEENPESEDSGERRTFRTRRVRIRADGIDPASLV
jgi:hypothetical protein